MRLQEQDPDIYRIFAAERRRQREGVELIPSENYVSEAVLEAMGTIFTNKYSEGYPGRRYYGGNENVDEVERLAQERARRLFGVPHANVQPYSGSPANLAVYLATCQPGDPIMGQNLPDGGHLTHGWKVSVTGTYYRSIPYHVKADGYIDIDEVRSLAREHRPKLLWCGATAYVREFPFEQLAAIADETGAFFATDIAHIAGLVIAGAHKSPVPFAHIVTTTTHKTLRGPRGAMILVTEKGLAKDSELAQRVDRAVFPGLQGGPHDHTTAAITVNKNTIPGEPSSAFYPSGIRLGTPAATTRGMREPEMSKIAEWIAAVGEAIEEFRLPEGREERATALRAFRRSIEENRALEALRGDVREFCLKFPVPGT